MMLMGWMLLHLGSAHERFQSGSAQEFCRSWSSEHCWEQVGSAVELSITPRKLAACFLALWALSQW